MKVDWKFLSFGCLLAGMMMVGTGQVFAESEVENDVPVETVDSTTESTADSATKKLEEIIQSDLETETDNSEIGQALQFSDLLYHVESKALYGTTAPNATIYVSIPNVSDQMIIQAEETGHFRITNQFTPGMEIVLVAHDELGNTGEPLTYTIPSQEIIDALTIRDVSYNHATKQLVGKTAPNARVGVAIEIEAGGQGIYTSDAQGNFVISETFDPGTPLVISATLDGVTGGVFRYTIPEESVNSSTESTDTKPAETKPTDKKGFPITGESKNIILLSVGVLIVLIVGYMIFKRKFSRSR